jgi:tagatose-1,6-bisphosphate aldolase
VIADRVETGPGTLRGLRQLTTRDGLVAAVAIDQRQALRGLLRKAGVEPSDEAMRSFKAAVARALAPIAPALLVDPQWGLPAIAADPAVDPRLPLLVSLEESGTVPWQGGRRSLALPGWSAAQARAAGACAGKLLVYARPDHPASCDEALSLVASVRAQCRAADLPFVLEILPFRLDGEDEEAYAAAYGEHVLACARLGDDARPDLLKLAFPGGGDEAAEDALLDALATLAAPWALLSAGAGYDVFASRLGRALERGGAVGFIVGRVLWQDAVGAPDVDASLAAGARQRLERLLELLERRRRRALPLPALAPDPAWFRA